MSNNQTIDEIYLINLISNGYSISEIAEELQVEESIIIQRKNIIFKKLKINSWKELIVYAIKNDIFVD